MGPDGGEAGLVELCPGRPLTLIGGVANPQNSLSTHMKTQNIQSQIKVLLKGQSGEGRKEVYGSSVLSANLFQSYVFYFNPQSKPNCLSG